MIYEEGLIFMMQTLTETQDSDVPVKGFLEQVYSIFKICVGTLSAREKVDCTLCYYMYPPHVIMNVIITV